VFVGLIISLKQVEMLFCCKLSDADTSLAVKKFCKSIKVTIICIIILTSY